MSNMRKRVTPSIKNNVAYRAALLVIAAFYVQPLSVSSEEILTLPSYQSVSGISGNLSSVGSDTLGSMITQWGERFKYLYPSVNIQIQAAGSSTAPPALIEGTAQFGPMSRSMKSREIEAFERQYGYKPMQIRVALDSLGIFVHRDNPIQGLNFKQLDSLFSATFWCGAVEPIVKWGDLGLTGEWSEKRVQLFGRNSVSGTYGFFKQSALCNGDFKVNVNEQPGSASVVQSIASSLNSIGYSGSGYRSTGVKLVPIAKSGTNYVTASKENAINGKYPLSRYLYIYVNKPPHEALNPLESEFIRFILSADGQSVVEKEGYIALPASVIQQELQNVGLQG